MDFVYRTAKIGWKTITRLSTHAVFVVDLDLHQMAINCIVQQIMRPFAFWLKHIYAIEWFLRLSDTCKKRRDRKLTAER